MILSPEKQLEQDITCCENIVLILDSMLETDITKADIFLKIDEIKADIEKIKIKVDDLKKLYKQVIL